jgi:hypothetical protein
MLRGKPGSQRANPARADDCQAYVFSLKSDDALPLNVTRKTTLPPMNADLSVKRET